MRRYVSKLGVFMGILSSLTREQKEAVGLLQIGTFLEYFDLMLYVHMAVLLNELFFPKTDPHTAALISAFAFCSTFLLRPFGALLFGYIGDTIGRKPTVIITTMMMSTSCIVMANLPTYAQIGIAASWIVTGCRIVQGFSSMGEIMGAQIYASEITKPPVRYSAVAFISLATAIGSTVALGISSLVTTCGLNWRIAFWVGAGIAVVGSVARTRLRETPEFVEEKKSQQREIKLQLGDRSNHKKKKMNKNTLLAYALVQCGWPLCFYMTYMYFNPTLKLVYLYTAEQIIFHNFLLSIVFLVFSSFLAFLCYKVHPLKILKIRGLCFVLLTALLPILTVISNSYIYIFLIQAAILVVALVPYPADSVFVIYFPVLRRFTTTSFIYAFTRAVMYVITSFSLVYLTEWFGHYGLWFIMIPVTAGFLWGVNHFIKLEKLSAS